MNERSDHDLGFVMVTQKVMPNGETRTRMRLPSDITTTITEMPDWKWEDGIPWQQGHYHKNGTEDYQVIHGWMIIVMAYPESAVLVPHVRISSSQKVHARCDANEPHWVLLGPGSVVLTVKSNSELGSPDWHRVEFADAMIDRYTEKSIKELLAIQ
jgi:hypothetical protein